jgi:thiamine-phosphate pyrophosphorylase
MTSMPHRLRTDLYLITPPQIADLAAFQRMLEAACEGGRIASLQVRLKTAEGATDLEATRRVALAIQPLLHAREIALIINDSPELAAEIDADGVHVGWDDMPVAEARAIIGPGRILGATAKNSRHAAMRAGEAGADYVAFGAFYATGTKNGTVTADLELLEVWQETMELPCVAIGGITPENAEPLVRAGADFLAVSAGVWVHAAGPAAAVSAFNAVFDRLHAERPETRG